MWRRVPLVLVGLSLTACAAAPSSSRRSAFAGAGRNVITAGEIVASNATSVYQAVSFLRPEFLRRTSSDAAIPRLGMGTFGVVVYVDDLPTGGAESLQTIPLDRVRLIRYLNRSEADLRWGGSHPAGVILVTTVIWR